MNKVFLMGRVQYPPRYNDTPMHGPALNCVVTTTHRYKNNANEIVERKTQHRVVLWSKLAELHRDTSAGDTVFIEGTLRNRRIQEDDGRERWHTEIAASRLELLVAADGKPADAPPKEEEGFDDGDMPF